MTVNYQEIILQYDNTILYDDSNTITYTIIENETHNQHNTPPAR